MIEIRLYNCYAVQCIYLDQLVSSWSLLFQNTVCVWLCVQIQFGFVLVLGNFSAQHVHTKCSLSKQSMMKTLTEGIFFPQQSEYEDKYICCVNYLITFIQNLIDFFFLFLMFALLRYSCINEINKCVATEGTKIFVYFVTKLPRMEGGTSYVGFQGG